MNKKVRELAIHDKDTGSSEIQIALLTDKIESLSKHIKQFKKDESFEYAEKIENLIKQTNKQER